MCSFYQTFSPSASATGFYYIVDFIIITSHTVHSKGNKEQEEEDSTVMDL